MWLRAIGIGARQITGRPLSAISPHVQFTSRTQVSSAVIRLCRMLAAKGRSPTLVLVNKLANLVSNPRTEERVLAVRASYASRINCEQWISVVEAQDFSTALQLLKSEGVALRGSVPTFFEQPPTWLVLHVICNLARTSADLRHSLDLVYHHLPYASPSMQPTIVVLLTIRLAQHGLLAPLRLVIKSFLNVSAQATGDQFNLLLYALTFAPGRKETSALATTIMMIMENRGMKIRPLVYNALLRPTFLTLDVAEAVERCMHLDGITPSRQHLTILLRLMARHGRRKQAARYVLALRGCQEEAPNGAVLCSTRPQDGIEKTTSRRPWTAPYISSLRSSFKAFRHIKSTSRVVVRQSIPSHLHPNTTQMSQSPAALIEQSPQIGSESEETDEDEGDPQFAFKPDKIPSFIQPPLSMPPPKEWKISHFSRLNVKDWAAALYVAGRDKRISAEALLEAFQKGAQRFGRDVNMFAYCVVIRGLLYKWDPGRAVALWDESRIHSHRLPLSTFSIGIGVSALTLNREPHRAFALLEHVSASHFRREKRFMNRKAVKNGTHPPTTTPGSQGMPPPKVHPKTPSRRRPPPPAVINAEAINQFMVTLQRIGRPDAVFALWDSMKTLYNLDPDAYTLSILLNTARWARHDKSVIRGALTQLGLLKKHRKANSPPTISLRGDTAAKIAGLFNPKARAVLNGMWDGESAAEVALRIATQMFLGNWPILKNVRTPVRALRHSAEDRTLAPLSDAFMSLSGSYYGDEDAPPPIIILAEGSTPLYSYPHIIPTDVTFRAYIDLLHAECFTTDIPLVLAWMRELRISPSKNTIASALVYWSEVSKDAPLIEAMKGGSHRSPYAMLSQWIQAWVGKEHMPTSIEWSHAIKRLAYYREAMNGGILTRSQMRREGSGWR